MEFISEIINREKFVIEHGSHNKDSMIIVLEGKFECTIQGNHFFVGKHDICVFYKDTIFERRVIHRLKCVYVQFASFPIALTPGILKTADLVRTENTILHLAQVVADGNAELAEHFIRDLFLMHRYPASDHSANDKIVSGCIAYFNENYPQQITLDMLAERFSISKQGLISKFKRHTQKTPMEYLAAIRITRSKTLLKDTHLSVSEIAGLCGFENVYYFSNFFKRFTGTSPSEYRKFMDL